MVGWRELKILVKRQKLSQSCHPPDSKPNPVPARIAGLPHSTRYNGISVLDETALPPAGPSHFRLLCGVGALTALTKSKKHYLGIMWSTGDKQDALVLQCDKSDYRGVLAGLEAISGKKAVEPEALTVPK